MGQQCGDISENYNAIYPGKGDSVLLAKKNGKAKVAYIELVPDENEEYYRINSALVSRSDYFKNKKPLWERAQTSQAGVVTPNPPSAVSGQSGVGTESSIPQDVPAVNSRPVEPGSWNDYDNMTRSQIVEQAKDRGVRTNMKTAAIVEELRSMNDRGVGSINTVVSEEDDRLYDIKRMLRKTGIKIPARDRVGIKLEDFAPLNSKGFPNGSPPGLWRKNGQEWDARLQELSVMAPDIFRPDMDPSEFFAALFTPTKIKVEHGMSLDQWLGRDTASGLPDNKGLSEERNRADLEDEEYIPFSTLDPQTIRERDLLLQRAGGDRDRAWKIYERMVAAAANRNEPVDPRKADAMRRAILGDQEQGDLFGEAQAPKERKSTFKQQPNRPVQQSLEGLDEGTLFSTFSPKEPPHPGQKGWGSGDMSRRAEEAIESGMQTAAMIAEKHGLKPQTVRSTLRSREWHHILLEGRKTPVAEYFYNFDPETNEVDAARLEEMRAKEKGQSTEAIRKRARSLAAKQVGLRHNAKDGSVNDSEGNYVGSFRPWGFDVSYGKNREAANRISERLGLNKSLVDGNYYTEEASRPAPSVVKQGEAAMSRVINEHTDIPQAMQHPLIGDLSFYWGHPGTEKKGFHDGHGVSHIIAARNAQGQDGIEAARHMIRVIANGEVGAPYQHGQRLNITLGEASAVFDLGRNGTKEIWLLTGWKEAVPDRSGESYNPQSYTRQSSVNRTDAGAGTKSNIPQGAQEVNGAIQEISSKDTSLNQVPSTLRRIKWQSGTRNFDLGAGRSSMFTDALKEKGVTNIPYDPFWKDNEENQTAVDNALRTPADTSTTNNILNVIKEPEARKETIRQAARVIKPEGTAYFLIYEGDKSGAGKRTSKGWQNNLKADAYVAEVAQHFDSVTHKGNLLVAKGPKDTEGSWSPVEGGVKFSTKRGGSLDGVRYDVGKVIGGRVYLHRDYAGQIGEPYKIASEKFREKNLTWDYNTVSYNPKTGDITFQEAPNFDTAREPQVGRMITVRADGTMTPERVEQQIYHHKWQWVGDDYKGFDVQESKRWSEQYQESGISNPRGYIDGWEKQLRGANLPVETRYSTATSRDPIQYVTYNAPAIDEATAKGIISKVVRHFRTTSDHREAGYVTPDGRMLDLSGKRDGGESGVRYMDHREVPDLGGQERSDDMLTAIDAGLARVDFTQGMVNISRPMGPKQKAAIIRGMEAGSPRYIRVEAMDGKTHNTVYNADMDGDNTAALRRALNEAEAVVRGEKQPENVMYSTSNTREDEVRNVSPDLLKQFGLKRITADFKNLYRKHSDYFKNPLEAQLFTEEVLSDPDMIVYDDPNKRPGKRLALRFTSRWGLAVLDIEDGEVSSSYPLRRVADALRKVQRANREGGIILVPRVKRNNALPGPATVPFNTVSVSAAIDIIRQNAQKVKGEEVNGEKFSTQADNLTIREELIGAYSGQKDLILTAQKDGKTVGYLRYSEYNDEPKVQMLEVDPEYRRRGVATALTERLRQDYPDLSREDLGMLTDDGSAFANARFSTATPESHLRPIGLPELERMAVEMLGSHPNIRRRLQAKGYFRREMNVGGIDLKADIFIGPDIHHAYSPKKPTQEQIDQHKERMAEEHGVSPDDLVVQTRRYKNGFITTTYQRDHSYAAKTLAHEIGHADDWLPEKDMERGNLLGRIAKLSHYLKTTLASSGDPEDALTTKDRAIIRKRARDLTSKDFSYKEDPEGFNARVSYLYAQFVQDEIEKRGLYHERDIGQAGSPEWGGGIVTPGIRTELIGLSQWWKGDFLSEGGGSYDRYRRSGKELYADAISVLLNSPDVLEDRAPQFYEALMNFFDKHQPMKDLYQQIQEEMQAGVTPEKRLDRDLEMMGRDSEVRDKAVKDRLGDRPPLTPKEMWRSFLYDLADTTAYLPTQEAKQAVKDVNYAPAKLSQYQRDIKEQVADVLEKAGVSWDHFGVYLMRRRAAGERQDMANPGLIRGADAKALLDTLRERVGDQAYQTIEEAAKALTTIRKRHIIPILRESGLFSEELMTKIENNDEYATFDVVDYFEKSHGGEYGALIKRQFGTSKDILNPFFGTVRKDSSLLFAAQMNIAKRTMVDQMRQFDADGIKDAEMKWNGVTRAPQEPANTKHYGLVRYMEDGVQKGVIVRWEIADLFQNDPVHAGILFQGLSAATGLLKSIFTANNPLFSLWNIQRDFRSTLHNMPTKGLANEATLAPSLALSYLKTFRDAYLHAFKKHSTPLMRELLEGGLLIADRQWTARDMTAVSEYDRMVAEFDLKPDRIENVFQRGARAIFHDFNQMVEVWTKLAGAEYMKRKGLTDKYDMRNIMRGIVGSPDFLTRGKLTMWTNAIFLYSNAQVQGLEASYRAIKANPVRYMLRRLAYTIIPSAIMAYLAFGDDDDDEIKDYRDAFKAIPDYEKARMITLPVSWDGNKVSWIPLPQDHVGELLHSLIWNMFASNDKSITKLSKVVLGAVPMEPGSLNPWLKLGKAAFEYARGQNPYDSFRGKPAINDQVFAAGGWRSHEEFMKWAWNQTGGSTFGAFEPPFQVRDRGTSGLPIVKPAMRRFIRTAEKQDAPDKPDIEHARTLVDAKDFAADFIRNASTERDANPMKAWRAWRQQTEVPKDYKFSDFKRVYQNLLEKRWPKKNAG